MISSYSLGATHLAIYVHVKITPIITEVESECIATGIGDVIGNKGAVGIRFKIGKTSMLCVCSHLASGQFQVERRNEDFMTIYRRIVLRQEPHEVGCLGNPKKVSINPTTNPVVKKSKMNMVSPADYN